MGGGHCEPTFWNPCPDASPEDLREEEGAGGGVTWRDARCEMSQGREEGRVLQKTESAQAGGTWAPARNEEQLEAWSGRGGQGPGQPRSRRGRQPFPRDSMKPWSWSGPDWRAGQPEGVALNLVPHRVDPVLEF